MNLRTVGTWIEHPWAYPQGQTHPQGSAVKKFEWTAIGKSSLTGDEMQMGVWTTIEVPINAMENLKIVADQEARALGVLEKIVRQATEGIGHIAAVNVMQTLFGAVSALIQDWITEGGYPEAWQDQLGHTFGRAHAITQQQFAYAKRLGATPETDPELARFGPRIPIVPLRPPVEIAS